MPGLIYLDNIYAPVGKVGHHWLNKNGLLHIRYHDIIHTSAD